MTSRASLVVEIDRLIAMRERQSGDGRMGAPGRLLRIPGEAMATSGQAELLTTGRPEWELGCEVT